MRLLHCHFDGAYGRGVENLKEVEDLEEDSCAVFWENVDVLAKAVVVLGYSRCERGSEASRA